MRNISKWLGIVLGALLGLAVLAAVVVVVRSNANLNQTIDVTVESIAVPTDAAARVRGDYLAHAVGKCVDCHGEDLAGKLFLDDPMIGQVYSANLTSGNGGVGTTFSDGDFVRAIRHGLAPDGRRLAIMPADDFYYFSDGDLGALIAYLRSVPAVDHEIPPKVFRPLGRILLATGKLAFFPADRIDQTGPRPQAPSQGMTKEYGSYLVHVGGCVSCHGQSLSGGPVPGAQPGAKPAPNLTPGGNLVGWSEQAFITAMRSGITPDGRQLQDPMPWKSIGLGTDEDLKTIWLYLQSLPARPLGQP
jgi:mono/diheme cytochrome c family protein